MKKLLLLLLLPAFAYSQTVDIPMPKIEPITKEGAAKAKTPIVKAGICTNFLQAKSDKVSGTTTIEFKSPIMVSKDGGKTGIGFYGFLSVRDEVALNIVVASKSVACVDEGAKVSFLFRDGSRLEIFSQTVFNCDGHVNIYFRHDFGKEEELKQLCTKEIETVRIAGRSGHEDQDFSKEQSKKLMNTLNCLANN